MRYDIDPGDKLTDREWTVLILRSQGFGPHEVAKIMKVSVRTVDQHQYNAKVKAGVRDLFNLGIWYQKQVEKL